MGSNIIEPPIRFFYGLFLYYKYKLPNLTLPFVLALSPAAFAGRYQINANSFSHALPYPETNARYSEAKAIPHPACRSEDIIGRLGGDEFCVFYTGKNNYEVIARKAEQICEAARNIYSAKGRALKTSISVGIARRVGNENFDELYRKADQALFVRKAKKGRDGFTIYAHDSNS